MQQCEAWHFKGGGMRCEHNLTHDDGFYDYHKTSYLAVNDQGFNCKRVIHWKAEVVED